jgi:hypothetical protein
MITKFFIVMLFCLSALSCVADATQRCDISGKWKNDNGSIISIDANSTNGTIVGVYYAGFGGSRAAYDMTGTYENETCTLEFCISWKNSIYGNSHDMTCWTGQGSESELRIVYAFTSSFFEGGDHSKPFVAKVDIFHPLNGSEI